MAIVKKLKQHPPLPPSRYEVGIYCRVSTASKTQVVSIGHQLFGLITDVANSHQARLYDVYLDIQSGRFSNSFSDLGNQYILRPTHQEHRELSQIFSRYWSMNTLLLEESGNIQCVE